MINEEVIREKWILLNSDEGWYIEEFPVWHPEEPYKIKKVDVLLILRGGEKKVFRFSKQQIEKMLEFKFQDVKVVAKLI
jgi:hypothetical protein